MFFFGSYYFYLLLLNLFYPPALLIPYFPVLLICALTCLRVFTNPSDIDLALGFLIFRKLREPL